MIFMSSKDVYNQIRLKNIKIAKLRQKEAELKLLQKKCADTAQVEHEIVELKKQINKL